MANDKKSEYRKYLLDSNSIGVLEAFDTFYNVFKNLEEFELIAKGQGVIKNVQFHYGSDKIKEKYFDGKDKHPFSFSINKKWLNFFFRVNHESLVTDKIKHSFDTPNKPSKTEYRLYIKNKDEALQLIDLLFRRKLNVCIPDSYFNELYSVEQIEVLSYIEGKNEDLTVDTVKEAYVKVRTNQGKYRYNLLNKWGNRCSVTGIESPNILIASHIKAFAESNDKEKYDVENGLMLIPNLDKLFDKHFISFDDDGKILLSSIISNEIYTVLGVYSNMKLSNVTAAMKKYLELHRSKFSKINIIQTMI